MTKQIELYLVEEIQIGDAIEMSYSGLPVLGTVSAFPLILRYRSPTGESQTLQLALSTAELQQLETQISNLLDGQKLDQEDSPSLN